MRYRWQGDRLDVEMAQAARMLLYPEDVLEQLEELAPRLGLTEGLRNVLAELAAAVDERLDVEDTAARERRVLSRASGREAEVVAA